MKLILFILRLMAWVLNRTSSFDTNWTIGMNHIYVIEVGLKNFTAKENHMIGVS